MDEGLDEELDEELDNYTIEDFKVGDIVYYEERDNDDNWKILRITESNDIAIKNVTTEEREMVKYTEIKPANAWKQQIKMGNDFQKKIQEEQANIEPQMFNRLKPNVLEEISSDESDDEYTENMNKLEQDVNHDYLQAYHPETKQINYKELLTLSNVTRNKKGLIIDPLHKTIPILTRYEKAKILGLRAKQINHGAKPFVEISRDIIDGHTIAYIELIKKKIPFIIRRPMPSGGSEYWKVSDLKNID
jgi:DNA-directed RNA polymerase subunit K/omega